MDKDKQIYPLTARILRPLRWEMNCIQVEIKGERSSFMKVAGIIAEYNPFHKGHQYHIEETRKKTGADYVVVVMSGDYVQRGEPAIADKYMRTRMALSGGADLIIEMPAIYATASAEYFATAGIGILDQLGCVDYLSFGSEWAEVEDFSAYATLFLEESEEYKKGQSSINFGSQIRSYVMHPYSMVKDHRTNYETSNVSKVLDGDIDEFIESYLNMSKE